MYEEFIMQLCMYAKAITILAKGYLPITHITNKIIRNSTCSSNSNSKDQTGLQYSHKKTSFILLLALIVIEIC